MISKKTIRKTTALICVLLAACLVMTACGKIGQGQSSGQDNSGKDSAIETKTTDGAAGDDSEELSGSEGNGDEAQNKEPAFENNVSGSALEPEDSEPYIEPPGAKDRRILMSGVDPREVRWNADGTKILGPLAPEYEFSTVDEDYFADALVIGDSRSVGIAHFGRLKGPVYFVSTSMSIYNYNQMSLDADGSGKKKSLKQLLSENDFGKVYVGLGINELGYDLSETAQKFRELIDELKSDNPDVIIYLMANLHVAAARSDSDKTYNNSKLNTLNTMLYNVAQSDTADNVYYIDVNTVFDDEDGNLMLKYTNDYTHLLTKYYSMWIDFLKSHAIVND